MIEELLDYNKSFVKSKAYEKFLTTKYPDKRIAIVTCMDTRLIELLPAALGLKNGDVKMERGWHHNAPVWQRHEKPPGRHL